MAHRIQMKLGVVPDAERAPDSPDTALHVEPRVGEVRVVDLLPERLSARRREPARE